MKLSLDIEYDYNFVLFGLSCHEKDYRICWALNKAFDIELKKENDLDVKEKKQKEHSSFSLYTFMDDGKYCEYFVISNRSKQGMLIPEQKQVDFFLKITGTMQPAEKLKMLKKLNEIKIVLTAYEIDANLLKTKQNLLF